MRWMRPSAREKSLRGGFWKPGGVESRTFHQQVPASNTRLPLAAVYNVVAYGPGALLAAVAVDRTFREHDEVGMLPERRAMVFPPDQVRHAVALLHVRALEDPMVRLSQIQSAKPTPYDEPPISSCSSSNARPDRRNTRFGPAVGARPQFDQPGNRIAGEEREADARVACPDHVVEHLLRPVLVVADREEGLPATAVPRPSACVSTLEMYVTS